MSQLRPLMKENFLQYASYVIIDRAIPDLRDGCKPVQRRILHTLHSVHDGKFHKVANIIGESMKLHPHGDASIGDALVVLANKEYFIEKQGNFGNIVTGHRSAAPRYIECRLTPLALETLFNKPLTEYIPSYDGRRDEPVFLPAKLPVALMLGPEGIAVGMATKILPHNLIELLQAQVKILAKKSFKVLPDFRQGGIMDPSEYEDGTGKVKVRARIQKRGDKKLVITEVPPNTTTESLIASIEGAAQKGKVKISSISDFTTDKVEIELVLARGIYASEAIPQLYAYTDCEVNISSNILLISDDAPVQMTVTEVLVQLTKQLKGQIKAELEYDLGQLEDREHWLTLEQIFIEQRVYKKIEKAKTEKSVRDAVWNGMHEYELLFVRPMVDDDIARLLEIRIRRISAYDIERNRKQLEEVAAAIKKVRTKLRNLTKTTTAYLEDLIKRYKDQYPRRTEIGSFETVDKKAVARQHIRLTYDPETSFFGSQVRGGKQFALSVSEYDRILAISSDGSYRVMAPPEKVLLPRKLLYCALFDPEEGAHFTVIYRDKKKICFGKRVHIQKFIKDKEYSLIKEGKIDILTQDEELGTLHMDYVPAKYQRVTSADYDLSTLEFMGVGARGVRLAPKPVRKMKHK